MVTIPLAGLAVGLIGVSGTGVVIGGAAVAVGTAAWWAATRREHSMRPGVDGSDGSTAGPADPAEAATSRETTVVG